MPKNSTLAKVNLPLLQDIKGGIQTCIRGAHSDTSSDSTKSRHGCLSNDPMEHKFD